MANGCNPYHSWEDPEQEVDGKSPQIAASVTRMVEMMPLWKIPRVADRLGQFRPKGIPKIG
ncbi:MAG: hypothetical protein CFE26_03650 [Verrucomicrobiales bacterium VVV1]|nr:MAG: hypothetical protein CFE26_03650 [Verrucomicrobiales bacterium VVV1]